MIAADTSAFLQALEGTRDPRLTLLRNALRSRELVLPPVVITELASAPREQYAPRSFIATIPMLELLPGYWERAGMMRADVRARGGKAAVPDCLIAQSCIDHDIPLITYDRDFRHFEPAGLKLL